MTATFAGYRGRVPAVAELVAHVRDVTAATGVPLQVMRAAVVAGREHVARAGELAEAAVAQGRGRADGVPLTFLCYAAGERQIAKALARAGVAPHANTAVVVAAFGDAAQAAEALQALAKRAGWQRDDSPLDTPDVRAALLALGVPDAALAGTPEEKWHWLAWERAALVDLP